ncbi:MAG: LPP20 family lipoprotein [Culturomica sp.]|jgi:hypothetical protein|nr:LPP20 family lipoprotein [Culturomica sp.]
MKRLLLIVIVFVTTCLYGQQKPDWVTDRPINSMYYIGIGRSLKTEKDYQQIAKQNALSDLVSEIKVEVSSNSLMYTFEDNNTFESKFKETIDIQAKNEIEKFQLVDTWENNTEYWVYYELNKFDYEEYLKDKQDKVTAQGYDYLMRGKQAMTNGELISAMEFYIKGLQEITPLINEDLVKDDVNVGRELYSSLNSIFDGVSINAVPESMTGKAFQGIAEPFVLTLSKNGTPLKNVKLTCIFKSGTGSLSSDDATDQNGQVKLYVKNINSKIQKQEIAVTVNMNVVTRNLRGTVYEGVLRSLSTRVPSKVLFVNLEKSAINAFVKVISDENEGITRAVKSLLTKNYFNVVSEPSLADAIVEVSSNFTQGGKVSGDMYDFKEYFTNVDIRIINNRSGAELLNYSINDFKTMVAESKTKESAKAQATRDVLKRLNKELSADLKEINIFTEGDIRKSIPTTEKSVVKTPTTVEDDDVVDNGEFAEGIYIGFVEMKMYGDRCVAEFAVSNTTDEDFDLLFADSDLYFVNEKGEKVEIVKMKLGASESNYRVNTKIVPKVVTALFISLPKLKEIKLAQFSNKQGMVKLRNLK